MSITDLQHARNVVERLELALKSARVLYERIYADQEASLPTADDVRGILASDSSAGADLPTTGSAFLDELADQIATKAVKGEGTGVLRGIESESVQQPSDDPRPCEWCGSSERKCQAWSERRFYKCCPDCKHQATERTSTEAPASQGGESGFTSPDSASVDEATDEQLAAAFEQASKAVSAAYQLGHKDGSGDTESTVTLTPYEARWLKEVLWNKMTVYGTTKLTLGLFEKLKRLATDDAGAES